MPGQSKAAQTPTEISPSCTLMPTSTDVAARRTHKKRRHAKGREAGRLTLLVGVLEGEGGGGAVLPGLGAEVVVEAGAGGHGLGVEVSGEGAILHNAAEGRHVRTAQRSTHYRTGHRRTARESRPQTPPDAKLRPRLRAGLLRNRGRVLRLHARAVPPPPRALDPVCPPELVLPAPVCGSTAAIFHPAWLRAARASQPMQCRPCARPQRAPPAPQPSLHQKPCLATPGSAPSSTPRARGRRSAPRLVPRSARGPNCAAQPMCAFPARAASAAAAISYQLGEEHLV